MIIYGVITETSIGKLFMAGVIPGIILVIFFCLVILGQCLWKPAMGPPGPKASFKETTRALGNSAEILGLIVLVFTGLQVGWFTPTEAGAVAAVGAILFSLVRKKLNFTKFVAGLKDTLKTTGMVYAMIIGAFIYSNFVAVSNIPQELTGWVSGLAISPILVIFVIIVIYIFLGCIMDGGGMMVLTIPIFFPIVMNLGFDPVWYGIVTVIVLEMGMVTPPVGMNVFIIYSIAKDVPMYNIFRGVIPFFLCIAALVVLLVFIPDIALFLPNLMK
jgi:tripartite ATP-independent transporter DctM subunit